MSAELQHAVMDQSQDPQDPPPPYSWDDAEHDPIRRFRNIRYQSSFVNFGQPCTQDFRDHLASIKVAHPRDAVASNNLPLQAPQYNVSYMQALGHISRLLDAFHACSREIRPLSEEDLLFLLLSRFAEQSGSTVYAEIQRSRDIQIYDSSIAEPLHAETMQGYLNDAPGILDAEIARLSQEQVGETTEQCHYLPLPQTPSEPEVPCTVTINYPALIPQSDVQDGFNSATLYHTSQTNNNIYPPNDWSQLPEKLQPPSFHVHRCHHEGVTSLTAGEAFELPLGFPEIVQYFHEAPEDFYHAGFFINNRSWLSPPTSEGDLQGFECHLSSTQTCFYITIKRNGDTLVYDCFRDEELWVQSHDGHQECSGC